MRRTLVGVLAILATAGGVACGDGGVDPDTCFVDRGPLRDLEVSAGATPVFSWCGFPPSALVVRTGVGGTERWRVECSAAGGCILPPVTYGVRPPNTNQPIAPQALGAGATFQVCLTPGTEGQDVLCSRFTT